MLETSTPPLGIEFALTSGKHRVEQQHPSVGNVLRQLVVEQSWLGGFLVSLDQNLANSHTPATLAQSLLHRLAGTHDRHAADLALELDTIVRSTHGRGDHVLLDGQVVQALLDKQANNAVGVEDEVGAVCVLVADDAMERKDMLVDVRLERFSQGIRTCLQHT